MILQFNFCCSDCFSSLAKQTNASTAKLWMELCAEYLDRKRSFPIELKNKDQCLFNLEQLGFIVTTDDMIGNLVRVNGFGHDCNEQIVFCLEREKHKYV